jgi:hypothetical protein
MHVHLRKQFVCGGVVIRFGAGQRRCNREQLTLAVRVIIYYSGTDHLNTSCYYWLAA